MFTDINCHFSERILVKGQRYLLKLKNVYRSANKTDQNFPFMAKSEVSVEAKMKEYFFPLKNKSFVYFPSTFFLPRSICGFDLVFFPVLLSENDKSPAEFP